VGVGVYRGVIVNRRRSVVIAALLLGVSLLSTAAWLLVVNQTVSVVYTDGGQEAARDVECSIAPYDAGFNGNNDPPGGEQSVAYAEAVASECYSANIDRFHIARVVGVLGLVALGVAIAVHRRAHIRSSA
jgi:hypothetical protein